MYDLKLTERAYDKEKSNELISFAQEIQNASGKKATRFWPPFLVLGYRFEALSLGVDRGKNTPFESNYQKDQVESAFRSAKQEFEKEIISYSEQISEQAKNPNSVKSCNWIQLKFQHVCLKTVVEKLKNLSEKQFFLDRAVYDKYTQADGDFLAIPIPENSLVGRCATMKDYLSKAPKNCLDAIAETTARQLRKTEDFCEHSAESMAAIAAHLTSKNLKRTAGALSFFALLSLMRNTAPSSPSASPGQWEETFAPGLEFFKDSNEPFLYGYSLLTLSSISIIAGAVLAALYKRTI